VAEVAVSARGVDPGRGVREHDALRPARRGHDTRDLAGYTVAGRGVCRLRERLGVVALLNVLASQARVLAGAGDVGDVDVTRRRAVEADKQLRLVGRVRVTGRHAAVVGGVPRVHRRGT